MRGRKTQISNRTSEFFWYHKRWVEYSIVFLVSFPKNYHWLGAYLTCCHCITRNIQTADIVFVLVDVCLIELWLILLTIQPFSHYYAQSCLMVNDPILAVEFKVVSTVETAISENIIKGKGLWRCVLFHFSIEVCWFKVSGIHFPRFVNRGKLVSNDLFELKLIISLHSMLDTSFYAIHVRIGFSEMPIDFFPDIRINEIIDLVLKIHLLFGDKTHIIEPIFVVLIFHTDLGEFGPFDRFTLIIVIFLKLLLIGCFNSCFFRWWRFADVCVIEQAHGGEWLKLSLLQRFLISFTCEHLEHFLAKLLDSQVTKIADCADELIFINWASFFEIGFS